MTDKEAPPQISLLNKLVFQSLLHEVFVAKNIQEGVLGGNPKAQDVMDTKGDLEIRIERLWRYCQTGQDVNTRLIEGLDSDR